MTYAERKSAREIHDIDTPLSGLEAAGQMKVYEAARPLFLQGDPCAGIFILKSGIVGLRRSDEHGISTLFDLATPGRILGQCAFLASAQHRNSAEALTICRVLVVGRHELNRAMAASPALREFLVQHTLTALDSAESRTTSLLKEGLKTRFLNLLLSLHSSQGHKDSTRYVLTLPIQRKDIAALIGAAPESLSRLMGKLESEALIRIDGRSIDFTAAVAQMGCGEANSDSDPAQSAIEALLEARHALLAMLEASDDCTRVALNMKVQAASARLDRLIVALQSRPSPATRCFKTLWESFKGTRQSEIIPAIFAGRLTKAKRIALGIQASRVAEMRALLASMSRQPLKQDAFCTA